MAWCLGRALEYEWGAPSLLGHLGFSFVKGRVRPGVCRGFGGPMGGEAVESTPLPGCPKLQPVPPLLAPLRSDPSVWGTSPRGPAAGGVCRLYAVLRVSPPSSCVVWARSSLKTRRPTRRKCSVNISHVLLLVIKCLKSWRGPEGPLKHDGWLFGQAAGCQEPSARRPGKRAPGFSLPFQASGLSSKASLCWGPPQTTHMVPSWAVPFLIHCLMFM